MILILFLISVGVIGLIVRKQEANAFDKPAVLVSALGKEKEEEAVLPDLMQLSRVLNQEGRVVVNPENVGKVPDVRKTAVY